MEDIPADTLAAVYGSCDVILLLTNRISMVQGIFKDKAKDPLPNGYRVFVSKLDASAALEVLAAKVLCAADGVLLRARHVHPHALNEHTQHIRTHI